MRLFVAAFVLAAVVPARAHHPVTSYYDTSQLMSVTGAVVEFRGNTLGQWHASSVFHGGGFGSLGHRRPPI